MARIVQSATNSIWAFNTSVQTTLAEVSAGNLIVACYAAFSAATEPTLSDSQGNSNADYTKAIRFANPGQVGMYFAKAKTDGPITVQADGSSYAVLTIYEIADADSVTVTGSTPAQSVASTGQIGVATDDVVPADNAVVVAFAAIIGTGIVLLTGGFIDDVATFTPLDGLVEELSAAEITNTSGIVTAQATAADQVTYCEAVIVAFGLATKTGSGEPFTRDDATTHLHDGFTVRFLRDLPKAGVLTGDVRKLSASVARERVANGDAEFVY